MTLLLHKQHHHHIAAYQCRAMSSSDYIPESSIQLQQLSGHFREFNTHLEMSSPDSLGAEYYPADVCWPNDLGGLSTS
jgi:hypothetical protein